MYKSGILMYRLLFVEIATKKMTNCDHAFVCTFIIRNEEVQCRLFARVLLSERDVTGQAVGAGSGPGHQ
jgi:hypothetical protein